MQSDLMFLTACSEPFLVCIASPYVSKDLPYIERDLILIGQIFFMNIRGGFVSSPPYFKGRAFQWTGDSAPAPFLKGTTLSSV